MDDLSSDARKVIAAVTTCLESRAADGEMSDEALVAERLAGAALSHAVRLLRRVDAERLEGDDLVVRLIARAHHETWMVGTYLHLGGGPAAGRVIGSYANHVGVQQSRLADHDAQLKREQDRVHCLNLEREQQNNGIRQRNANTGDSIPERELIAAPGQDSCDMDFSTALEVLASWPGLVKRELSFSEIAAALPTLVAEAGYGAGQPSVFYDLVYRGLSNLGSHTNYWVLETYLQLDPDGNTVNILTTPNVSPMANACLHGSILLTAHLAMQVLEGSDCDLSIVEEIADRYIRRTDDRAT